MADGLLNARDFGAKGDGHTDDTAAIQSALDNAAQVGGGVFVPPGTYLSGELHMRPHGSLIGVPGFSYRNPGGTIIRLNDPKARCLVNITGAFGCTIEGVCLMGERMGQVVHGILLDKPDYGKEEDAFRIERCLVSRFTGHGASLQRVWCFSLRHSMLAYNKGDGVNVKGWDGFILDNWFSGNEGAGYHAPFENASVTMTGNRIEWNQSGGIVLRAGTHYNITGNYIDRCGGSAIALLAKDAKGCAQTSITGNVIYRSGRWSKLGTHESSHVRMESAEGVTFVGNTLVVGRDDGGKGEWSPSYGIIYGDLVDCVIKDNVLHNGALETLMVDTGGNKASAIVQDNTGCLFEVPKEP